MRKLAFLFFLLPAATAAGAGEIWVVASAGKSVKVVDTASESVIATIPLFQGDPAPPARALTFSTVDGLAGAFAFVGQGDTLHVVEANVKSLTTSVDLEAALGLPLTIVDLESSPNREFAGEDGAEVRAYLAVAADAVREQGSDPEPYWAVLDQRALLESPPSVPLVAASGFLEDSSVPVAERGRAAGVSVLGSPRGAAHLRVWITTRVALSPERMRATLLEKGPSLDAPWLVGRSVERVLPQGRSAPESFTVAVPQDGQAQVFPAGATGVLLDLGHDGSCELSPANLGPTAVRGPGAGGYEIVAVDLDSETLLRVNESTCEFERLPLGSAPADLTVDALFEHGAAWIANRDSDDVSVVRLDGSSARVPLGPAPDGPCLECPVSIEARIGAGRACSTTLRLGKSAQGVRLTWDSVGCTGASYPVFCQCDRRFGTDCACECEPGVTPGCFGSLPLAGKPGVEAGQPGPFGPLTRQLPPWGPDPEPMPTPPEPVIQLGVVAEEGEDGFDDTGGGGGTWVGTRPP